MKTAHQTFFLSVVLVLIIYGCSDLLVNEPETNQNIRDFEVAWSIADQFYPFFEFKRINWDSLHSVYKPEAEMASGDEIYFVLYDMFRELKDGHIEINTDGGFPVATYLPPREGDRKSFSPTVVRKYFRAPLKLAGDNNIDYEFVDDKTGYIHITTFKNGNWIRDFDRILDYFKSAAGLIIDVRNNDGGNTVTSDYVISKFISEPMVETFTFSDGSKQSWLIRPRGHFTFTQPVVILINGASFSAAEGFPELMRQLPNVTLVGDTTGGGGGGNNIFDLPSGKRLRIPIKYFTRLDGEMVEWNGVLPDVLVEQTATDVEQGRDKQLEYAIQLLTK